MNIADLRTRWLDASYFSKAFTVISPMFMGGNFTPNEMFDLKGLIIGIEGGPPQLFFKGIIGSTVANCDFSYGMSASKFTHSTFKNCVFHSVTFDTVYCGSTCFSECDFSSARLANPTLDDAVFEGCKFELTKFSGRRTKEKGGRRTKFIECNFSGAVFQYLSFRACSFHNCTFENTKFQKCILIGTKFESPMSVEPIFEDCER